MPVTGEGSPHEPGAGIGKGRWGFWTTLLVAGLVVIGLSVPPVAASLDGPDAWPTTATWVETERIAPDDANEPADDGSPSHWGANFGASVAIDGDTMVVGTQTNLGGDQDGTYDDGGDWAYVFERDAEGTWQQAAKLIPDDAHGGDTFAFSVDVDEDSGVVVAGNPGSVEETNKAYIFERQPDGSWDQTFSIHKTTPGADHGGEFGHDVSVSGHTVAITQTHGELGTDPFTFLYEKVDGTWQETAALTKVAAEVSIAGDRLVGIFAEMTSCVDKPVCTHTWIQVYNRVEGTWVPGAVLDPTSEHNRSQTLVTRVALSDDGETVVIGAPVDCRVYGVHTQNSFEVDTPLGTVDASTSCGGAFGSAWIYDLRDGRWVQTADLANPDPAPHEVFGVSVDVSDGIAVIGAYGDTHNGAPGAGAAYVYEQVGSTWTLEGKLRNHDNGPVGYGDFFGESVGVSGTTVVAGAPWDDQRRDGTPPPLDDAGDLPAGICAVSTCSGVDDGENAGSVYVFAPVEEAPSMITQRHPVPVRAS